MMLSSRELTPIFRAVLDQGHSLRIRAYGRSMLPFIRDGDDLTIAPLEDGEPHVGHVILYHRPESQRQVIHRVIGQTGTDWLVRGDNSMGTDEVVRPENILGRVMRVERGGHDVHWGLGPEEKWIAWTSRRNGFVRLNGFARWLNHMVQVLLRCLQGIRLYRVLAKRAAPRIEIGSADADDWQVVLRRFPLIGPRQTIASGETLNYMAKRGSEVLGAVSLAPLPETGLAPIGHWLCDVCVRTRFRGMGTGEALMRLAIDEAKARGGRELVVRVLEDSRAALSLGHKLGFERVSCPLYDESVGAEAQGDSGRRVTMRKVLA